MNIKHKSVIVFGFIILMILSISGCKKAEKNNLKNNTPIPTLTLAPKPTGTVTPASKLSPVAADTVSPISSSAQSEENSASKTDESWIKAYYEYIVNNESQYDPYLLLIDLNFDGVPELFDLFIAEGSQAYRNGITFMNGKVMSIDNDKIDISVFVGTMSNEKKEKVWYTRYYTFGVHNPEGAEIDINSYNCSDLFDITGENLFQIGFTNTNADVPDPSSVNVSVLKNGKTMKIASLDKQSIINWYLNDKNSDFGSDWYNNQRLTEEELNSLLPLAQFEGELNIQEQKSANVDLNKCYTTTSGTNSLDYKLFYNQVMDWYNGNQIKQWNFLNKYSHAGYALTLRILMRVM